MRRVHRAVAVRAVLLHADDLAVRYPTLLPVGMLAIGAAVIAAGGLIGAMFASPVAPSIEILAAIRLVGIGAFSVGIGLLRMPAASLRRALFAYSTLATLYFCSLMLAATLLSGAWPQGWVVMAAAVHGGAMAAIVANWLGQCSGECVRPPDARWPRIPSAR